MPTQMDTISAKKKHEEADAFLAEFYPHCRQRKKDCRCKMVANVEVPNFKLIQGEDEQVLYVSQRRPNFQRQGMPPDPLSFFSYSGNSYVPNNQWQSPYAQNFGNYQNWYGSQGQG